MFSLFNNRSAAQFPDLRLFNSESRALETFAPLAKNTVRMYTCGPTVYDYAHIGNLRAYVFADSVKRALLYNGYTVNHTINFTDFGHLTSDADSGEDKMMKGLRREGMDVSLESMRLLSDRYIDAFKKDVDELNIVPPSQWARASDYVKEQITLIETLVEKGYTYQTSDGIYFEVSKFPSYGRLGNIDINALRAGARVEENKEKHHPADFALWKFGELGWPSKWGVGFPGWHVECSAMAFATLGKQLDIHTGGIDNMPTHHNGEIAQCEAATNKQFVRYWMHSEHIEIDHAKIAKSEGNSIILKDLLDKGYSGDDYRYWLLQSHYRTKAQFSYEALDAAKQALTRMKRLVFEEWRDERGKLNTEKQREMISILNQDIDTPKLIAWLHDMSKDTTLAPGDRKVLLLEADQLLGIGLSDNPDDGLEALGAVAFDTLPEDIQDQVMEREAARVARNWGEADRLRDAIKHAGYEIKDNPEGPQLTRIK